MTLRIIHYTIVLVLCWSISISAATEILTTTLHQSVEQALEHSPRLQALNHSRAAIEYDLRQSRGNFGPSVDLELGYGLEQHSDETTREAEADPAASDWDPRNDASLRLTQRLYDGGETRYQVSIQQALLDATHYRRQAAAQSVALDAIAAHLEIYRQRELIDLARKNLKFHRDIYNLLAEREQAGAGSIADVTQAQARMARAESTLYIAQADLNRSSANYIRVVGTEPHNVAYARIPRDLLPASLEVALLQTEQHNPELLAFDANLAEADAKVDLTRTNYKPKINLELSSRFHDQLDGDDSWQHTNDAMLVLRWNLYKGGKDEAAEMAALSRKHQSRSDRNFRRLELREATSAAWASFESIQHQKKAYRQATTFSQKTLEAYVNQFGVSKRDLLDVLSAANDYALSASQLISATVNQTIAAYRILFLGGMLELSLIPANQETAIDLGMLSRDMAFPAAFGVVDASKTASVPEGGPIRSAVSRERESFPEAVDDIASPDDSSARVILQIGPCVSRNDVTQATEILTGQGLAPHVTQGSGPVKFTRLLEGTYTPEAGRQRLTELKKIVNSAFVLPDDGSLALYAGSFHKTHQAIRLQRRLAKKQIDVTSVVEVVETLGTFLIVEQVARPIAEQIAEQMSQLELTNRLLPH